MGKYLNPTNDAFVEALNSEIYIDKSNLIAFLNTIVKTKQKYVSVSRPRRFGKTFAADMICAYYGKNNNSKDLFSNLKLADGSNAITNQKWDCFLGKFDVIRLVMTDFFKENTSVDDSLNKMQQLVIRDLKKTFTDVDLFDDTDLIQTMDDIYAETGHQFVIVIDEWDAVFRETKEDTKGQTKYLDFLRDWLKDKQYVALAYMTGILPIKKYGKHSALNMFDEYSIISPMQLAEYTGFTEIEVKDLCKKYGRDFDTIKEWYDGYEVSDIIPPDPDYTYQNATGTNKPAKHYSIFSPLSVLKAVQTGYIQNYWNKTENYEALAKYINMNYEGLKDLITILMDGGTVPVDISTYQNDMTSFASKDDILALLINLGYLKYDMETKEAAIPNREILDEFKASTKGSEWDEAFRALEISQSLVEATWACNAKRVEELLEKSHNRVSNKTYNDEAALSYAIQYAYYAAQRYYTTILELDSGKGYADIVYLPSPRYSDKPALLVELKYDKSAKTALTQIKERAYPDRLVHYKGNILLVGINYDKEVDHNNPDFKHHRCIIERA